MEDQELKQEIKELKNSVVSIDKNFSVALQRFNDFFAQNSAEHNKMNDRIDITNGKVRMLEKWKWGLMGGLTVILFLLGWIFDYVKNKF